jgi:superoxide dismutase
MSQKTIGIQGSGWGVLAIDNYSKLLRVITLANQ